MTTPSSYPVHVTGRLDEPLSRGLWLVKWLLLIPHFLVLLILWFVACLFTIAAFFGILFTGRYPKGIFDFNVGVLRWTWRVGFYSYHALGTDKYPPFSLDSLPDYPADLHIDYPERLSRGLIFVKWLLAIPQLIVVAILAGQFHFHHWRSSGLIGILVLFAGIVLLFKKQYPRALFDFIMGLNRWVMRVSAYVLLMRDEYPPFRFEGGEVEKSQD